ncbi:ABC transporter permease [Anaerocolumna sp.]|uniref:ABC transporter permease n=1 Tax=Anaerocolumna sp. TaxID=2041569 RepID=UPI0028A999DC|nr:ABC transporter permease [Anaerocolumna sp.]
MNKNKVSLRMIQYELRNVAGNPFVHIFGVGFPILLSIIITKSVSIEMPDNSYLGEVITSIFLGIGAVIPMATILMGYSSTCSQDIEKNIPLRMQLFGFNEKYTIINRLIAEFIYMTFAFLIYFIVGCNVIEIVMPVVSGVIIYFVCLYIFAAVLFILAHAIANLVKKFGLTYMITMLIYFGMMILSGMMGITVDKLPKSLRIVSNLLPSTYFTKDFYTVWIGKAYNFGPMIQSYIFFFAISGILIFIMIYNSKRNLH